MLTTALKSASGILALVVMAVAVIAQVQPELFLRLPMGFIPWAVAGGPMPPYFVEYPLYNPGEWLQDGDVILATGAKSGTAWVTQIVHVLKTGDDDYAKHGGRDMTDEAVGLLEMVRYPGQPYEERLAENKAKRNKFPPPMCWFSHKFPGGEGAKERVGIDPRKNPTVKYILVTRNGREVVRSFHPFLNAHTDEFRSHWGGFPPRMTEDQIFDFAVYDEPDFYFGYVSTWWQYRHEPNVLFLHFSNLKQDLNREVKRIADFLQLPLTEERLRTTVEKSSFAYMKANHDKFLPYAGRNHEIKVIDEGGYIRAGKADKGGDFFTPELERKWEAAVEKHFGLDPELARWASDGGEFE